MSDDSFIHACAGGVGGMVAMTATYPLVGISTRAAVESSKNPEEPMIKAALKILQQEGVAGLYAGLSSSLLGIGVTNFVYYFFFEKCRETILQSKAKVAAAAATSVTATIANGGALSTFESILAGVIAGTATTVSTNPIWIVNTRQTVRVGVTDKAPQSAAAKAAAVKRLGFLQTMQKIVREEGPLALWKGLGPALVLVINPVLQYTAFEQLKNWVVKSRLARANGGKVALSDWDFFWLGALSKLFATGLTYPQIVIKSRQHAGSSKGASTNIWTAMTEIVNREGIAGLYRGITSKLLQSVLTAAILFLAKERVFNITKALMAPAVAAAPVKK
ncbi:Mitochondrial substrate/solute carrier [Kalmanozyma brasiliensis GHG001]|uniref:Mitochondrial carrier protein n=1 Tax=Kalmanozyma brasiliensis (strain GHG001) TaxID=1365824 RepID=V5ERH3_KALBG|nr:Mitochondrial substrate/solute carrier [Kalmanozyma brasiliensis GHG001]EST07735.1 Mitochondrial substrate/solute carrier [Kalmanozyma brasiliensis GHG001]